MKQSLEYTFTEVFTKFKIHFYQQVFGRLKSREATLSAVETFSVEVINAMGTPTVSQFAEFVNISVANASFKVQSLIKKGYLRKERSEEDKREFHLVVTDRFREYQILSTSYINLVIKRIEETCSLQDVAAFKRVLEKMSNELMPEIVLHKHQQQ